MHFKVIVLLDKEYKKLENVLTRLKKKFSIKLLKLLSF